MKLIKTLLNLSSEFSLEEWLLRRLVIGFISAIFWALVMLGTTMCMAGGLIAIMPPNVWLFGLGAIGILGMALLLWGKAWDAGEDAIDAYLDLREEKQRLAQEKE
jgi:predicted thioredoxin/glutaredoxin